MGGVPGELSVKDRKRLWTRAGDSCAYTGCEERLLHPADGGRRADTVIGEECHIVARSDDPGIARSLSSLTEGEKARWAELIENRHGYPNRVLMCRVHAKVIDDPDQGFTIAQVVEMKHVHEAEVERRHRLPVDALPIAIGAMVRTPLLDEDVGRWQRKAWRALEKADPAALDWLVGCLGSPAEKEKIKTMVAGWPARLREGPRELPVLLVREAEAAAMWGEAAASWERIADAENDDRTRADFLARAAIDAGVGGDSEGRERLLGEAEAVDPNCARARMARVDDRLKPSEQLAYLSPLETDDPDLASMLACRRALAYLQDSDLTAAEREVKSAEELDPDSLAVQVVRINLDLQEARIALLTDRPFLVARVLSIHERALELREQLVAMGRFEESVRLLMMAADARSLLRDLDGARRTLEEALPQEISVEQGAAVLGDAALRSAGPKLALRFVDGAEPDDGIRRISASAHADLGGPGKAKALLELEALALGRGPEAEAAAISRLILCMAPNGAPWNDEVAAVAEGGEHDRHVKALRTLTLADSDPQAALEMAHSLPSEPWGAEVRLRVAGIAADDQATATAAKEFLSFSPDGAGRLLAAQGLARGADLERAGEVSGSVARDPNVPAPVRSDAFHVFMKTLADRDSWSTAERTWKEWRDFAFRELATLDGRVSAWQVRVIHNRQRGSPGRS
jgi:tetratricopeptide (TPR) repeat protein